MNRIFLCLLLLLAVTTVVVAAPSDTIAASAASDSTSLLLDEAAAEMSDTTMMDMAANGDAYSQLKVKFVEGGAGFMSLVALCLIIGLAFCIERIIYLSMSEIDAKRFMQALETKLKGEGQEAAKELCRNTRGPVASICYQGVLRLDSTAEEMERSISSYASVQIGKMEKGCSWTSSV